MRKIQLIMMFAIVPFFSFGQRFGAAIPAFHSVEVGYDLNVHFSQTQALEYDVIVEAPDEVKSGIQFEIDKKGVLRFIIDDKKLSLNDVKIFLKAPEMISITLGKAAVFTFDTDINTPKSGMKIALSGDATVNAKKIAVKELGITLKDNSTFASTVSISKLSADARSKSKLILTGEASSVKFSATDKAQINVESMKGKSLSVKASDNSAVNLSFKGKSGEAISSGSATIQLRESMGKVSLTAKDNSVINIRNLSCKNIKTATQKLGVIER